MEYIAIRDFRMPDRSNKMKPKPAIFAPRLSLRTRVLDRGRTDFRHTRTPAIGHSAESTLIVNRPDCPSAGGVQTWTTKAVIPWLWRPP